MADTIVVVRVVVYMAGGIIGSVSGGVANGARSRG